MVDPPVWPPTTDSVSRRDVNALNSDHRARLALAEEERAQRRRVDLDAQRSHLNPIPVRIRAWEKVHALRLPSDPAHAILEVIAADTGLTLGEVQAEQQARRSPPTRKVTPSPTE